MRETILKQIKTALQQRREFYTREQDIQLYLANFFLNSRNFLSCSFTMGLFFIPEQTK